MSILDLADVAAEQWGLITTAQAGMAGQSPQAVARLAEQRVLERLAHGVYRLAGTPADPRDDLRAAWLALSPRRTAAERLRDEPPEVVSHRSAAWLLQLGDVEADLHEFTVIGRRQTRRRDVRFRRGRLAAGDWTVVDGLPVTTAVRTAGDLADDRLDGGHLAGVARDALVVHQVDIEALIAALRPHAHRYGVALGDGEALLRRFLADAGLPETTRRTAELARVAVRHDDRDPRSHDMQQATEARHWFEGGNG
jgi:predicted transcriptional regulator of viral defense system